MEGLIVGEDVASSENKTGGRSMVGEVLFYKVSANKIIKKILLHDNSRSTLMAVL